MHNPINIAIVAYEDLDLYECAWAVVHLFLLTHPDSLVARLSELLSKNFYLYFHVTIREIMTYRAAVLAFGALFTVVAFEEKIKDDFATKQNDDPLYKKIIEHIEKKQEFVLDEKDFSIPEIYRHMKNNLGRYHLVDDKLYYQSEKGLSLLCVPGSMREEFLRYGHENIFSGHRGVKKN